MVWHLLLVEDELGLRVGEGIGISVDDVRHLEPLPTQTLNDEEGPRLVNLGRNGAREVTDKVMMHCVPNERVAVADVPTLCGLPVYYRQHALRRCRMALAATVSPIGPLSRHASPRRDDARPRGAGLGCVHASAADVWGVTRERWMAALFALGSTCFLVGPFPGYAQLVGAEADAVTFFVGSILFTAGGAVQTAIGFPDRRSRPAGTAAGPRPACASPARRSRPAGTAAWRAATIQSAGTLFFNVTTYQALHTALSNPDYNRLVWRPDALGSICFLVSGAIAYRASARHGWRPARGQPGWWEPSTNLLGCVFFGIAAVAGYLVPSTGSVMNLAAANWNTALGAACFLACAVATLLTGRTLKSARHRP